MAAVEKKANAQVECAMVAVPKLKTQEEQIIEDEKRIDALKSRSAIFTVTGMCPPFSDNSSAIFIATPSDNNPFAVKRGDFTASGDKRRPESPEEILLGVIPREALRGFLRGDVSEDALWESLPKDLNDASSKVLSETLTKALNDFLQGAVPDCTSRRFLQTEAWNDALEDVMSRKTNHGVYVRFLRRIPENALEEKMDPSEYRL